MRRRDLIAAALSLPGHAQILAPIVRGSGRTPVVTSNLVARWAAFSLAGTADNTALSQWNDSSGNGNHLTQANPACQPRYRTNVTLGGKPCVYFEQFVSGAAAFGQQYMDMPAVPLFRQGHAAVFLVGEYGPCNTSYPTPLSFGNSAASLANVSLCIPPCPFAAGPFAPPVAIGMGAGALYTPAGAMMPLAQGPASLLFGASTTTATVRTEGRSRTRAGTYNPATTFTGGKVGLWGGSTYPGSYTDMAVYEILVYAAYPNAAEITQLENYAGETYGAPRVLRSAANIVCVGDSITAGQCSLTLQGYPAKMARTASRWRTLHIVNWGVPGRTAATLYNQRTYFGPPGFSSDFARNILVIFAGHQRHCGRHYRRHNLRLRPGPGRLCPVAGLLRGPGDHAAAQRLERHPQRPPQHLQHQRHRERGPGRSGRRGGGHHFHPGPGGRLPLRLQPGWNPSQRRRLWRSGLRHL